MKTNLLTSQIIYHPSLEPNQTVGYLVFCLSAAKQGKFFEDIRENKNKAYFDWILPILS